PGSLNGVRLQAVEVGTSAPQYLVLLPRGQRPDPIQHDAQDGIVIASHGAYRPVRTDHQAPRAEQLQTDVQVGGEILRTPPPPVGTVGQSRHLTKDVRAGRQRLQPGLPRGELSRPDVGEAEVVEYESLAAKASASVSSKWAAPRSPTRMPRPRKVAFRIR